MGAHILATSIVTGAVLYLSRHYLSIRREWSHDLQQYVEFFRFSGLTAVSVLLFASLYNVDIILIRYFLDSSETGYYKAALTSAEFIWFIPYAVQTLFVHSTSEYWSQGQTEKIDHMLSKATKYGLLLTCLMSVGLASLGGPFLRTYFGTEFDQALIPLIILLPGAVGFALARPIYAAGYARGKMKPVILATIVPAIINFVLNLLLIPRYEMVGAATATSVGYLSLLLFHLRYSHSLGVNPLSEINIYKIVTVTGVTGIVLFYSTQIIDNDILSLVTVPVLGTILFGILAVGMRIVTIQEIKSITS
jgi:O-antigen/teichoic acid export membrane protein